MTHRTRPALRPLALCFAALALLHAGAFAPRLRARQKPAPPVVLPPVVLPPASAPAAVQQFFPNPLKKEWLLYALRSRQHEEAALVRLVERRGVSFQPTAEDEKELRAAGAADRLLEAVRNNYAQPIPYGSSSGGGMAVGFGPGRGGNTGGGGPGGGDVDYSRPFKQTEVPRKALITYKPEPGFTEEARKNGVEGVVRLRAVLNSSGEVTNITVIKGLPDGLTEKAIAAARRVKFRPAEKDGRQVSQYVVFEYDFNLSLDEKEVDERAIILEKPEAEYTEEARRNNVRGKVVLKVTLTSHGTVSVDSVEAGLPHGLTEKAVEAAARIRFEPARRGGDTVSQRTTVEYTFGP